LRKTQVTHAADIERQLQATERLIAIQRARDHLLPFIQFTMPSTEAPDDASRSRYVVTPQARLLCEVMEKVARGELLRVAISIGPQLGKSEVVSRRFPAWFMGKYPFRNWMQGTYSQDFAEDFGGDVREIMQSEAYRQVFPDFSLRKGSKAKDELKTGVGGRMAFLGRGGAGTGKPADIFIIDDPIKDDSEAQSPTIRKATWAWFNKVVYTRCHKFSAIVIVHTRWHEDDLIGRLCDPKHPEHDPEISKEWVYINIPSVVKDPALAKALGLTLEVPTDYRVIDQFGDEPMAALWEDRKSLVFLGSARRLDKRGFEALYQGRPTPDDGDYFRRADLIGYAPHELPRKLRWYAASDHALTEDAENDANCVGAFGIDENDEVWIPPEIFWERVETDKLVDEMIAIMKHRKPQLWFAADEQISKGFGPFLRKAQKKHKAYTTIVPIVESSDIRLRARSVQGMTRLHMVHFPKFAPWWLDAEHELLKFPNGAHDDFVAFLALIGLGLDLEIKAPSEVKKEGNVYKVGTLAWVKYAAERERKARVAYSDDDL
jgi:predicted phage terminase large subunit-like protein